MFEVCLFCYFRAQSLFPGFDFEDINESTLSHAVLMVVLLEDSMYSRMVIPTKFVWLLEIKATQNIQKRKRSSLILKTKILSDIGNAHLSNRIGENWVYFCLFSDIARATSIFYDSLNCWCNAKRINIYPVVRKGAVSLILTTR